MISLFCTIEESTSEEITLQEVLILIGVLGFIAAGVLIARNCYIKQFKTLHVNEEVDITVAIPGENGKTGCITAHVKGMPLTFLAKSQDNTEIKKGEKARITCLGKNAIAIVAKKL